MIAPQPPHVPLSLLFCAPHHRIRPTAAALLPRLPFHAAPFARLFRCPCLFPRGGMGNLHSQEHPPILFSRRAAFVPSRVRRMTLWMFLVGTLAPPRTSVRNLLCPWLTVRAKAAKGRPVQNSGRGSVCGICRGFSTRSAWFITNSLRTCQPPPAPQIIPQAADSFSRGLCLRLQASGFRQRRVQPMPSGALAHPSRRCNTPLRASQPP